MKTNTFYFDSNDKHCPLLLGHRLADMIMSHEKFMNNIVLLCIGSDRSTGDSLGPLIGYKLSRRNHTNLSIYGTLESPVHAINLCETMDIINFSHPDSLIIAMDACVGKHNHIGYITLSNSPLYPGLGVQKKLPQVGDICITGIVNFQNVMDNMILQTTRLDTVMKLADSISEAITKAVKVIDVPLYN